MNSPDDRPLQFGLSHLFLITTLIAVDVAMLTGCLGRSFQFVAQALAIVAISYLLIIGSVRFAKWYERLNDSK